MKYAVATVCLLLSACATRHVPSTATWFADCYNKRQQETLIAQAERSLDPGDLAGRRQLELS